MKIISTHEAARLLGIHFTTLAQYVSKGKLPAPTVLKVGRRTIHAWTAEEIDIARKLLPKIANGRKTRYTRKQSVKAKSKTRKKKPQPRAAVPHKQRRKKK